MPPRRDPRPSSDPSGSARSGAARPRERVAALRRQLRPPTSPELLAAAIACGGALAAFLLLSLLWPERDRAYKAPPEVTPATLAEKPQRPVTVLVIGLDADRLDAAAKAAAPPGPPNADALLLVRVQPRGPLQVLNLPTELAVRLPGEKAPVALGSLYRRGGVALTADAVRELTGLHPPSPDRYVLLSRGALRQLINGIGGIEVNPPRMMRYQDKAQKLKIDLQGGLQRFGGAQVEQLVRFRDPDLGPADRRSNQQVFVVALRERLGQNEPLTALPGLLNTLQDKVETNLSVREALSLLAAGLDDQRPIAFASLPLDPARPSHGPLRQLSRNAPNPVWPEPKP